MELNILSQALVELMVLITAILHLTLPSSVEPLVSAFMIGNLFAIYVFPFAVIYGVSRFFGVSSYLPVLMVVYLVTINYDPQHLKPPDNKRFSRFRSLNWVQRQSVAFWSSHFSYFPMTVKFDKGAKEAIDPNKQYIFAVHPHGIHCWPLNVFALISSAFYESFPGMKLCGVAATVMFKLPVIRELFLTMHYRDAGRKTCERILAPPPSSPYEEQAPTQESTQKSAAPFSSVDTSLPPSPLVARKGQCSLFICTGGEAESLQTECGVDKVVLLDRKGFVRLALSWGCALVPCYGLGVTDLYTTYSVGADLRRWVAKVFHVALPLFSGRWLTPLPHKRPVTVLVGVPIEVPTPDVLGGKPSGALVDEYHSKYMAALTELYKAHAPPLAVAGDGVGGGVGGKKRQLYITKP